MTNIDELKSTGLKATLPRLKILEIFQKGDQRHMTAEDVFRVLFMKSMKASTTTTWCAWTAARSKSFLTPKLKSASKRLPKPRALPSPTTR